MSKRMKKSEPTQTQEVFHYSSPLGTLVATFDGKNVSRLVFADGIKKSSTKILPPYVQKLFTALDGYFAGKKTKFTLPQVAHGTLLQREVWDAVCGIPHGVVVSYADVAKAIGRPTAVRAVASAIAKNQIAILIPCHRVVGSDGKMRGYAWGVERKEKLIALESGR